jgi:hypothetical protein
MKSIMWPNGIITVFKGRNGIGNCGGIEIWKSHVNSQKSSPPATKGSIALTAITSRGKSASCDIVIPWESVPMVILALQAEYNKITEQEAMQ